MNGFNAKETRVPSKCPYVAILQIVLRFHLQSTYVNATLK